ncbi:MAG: avidin/streptavidin family protein [Candidatus Tectimicrobiota bacterium]
MPKLWLGLAVLLGFCAAAANVLAESCQLPSGKRWQNDRQSTMTVEVEATGALSGTYVTAVGCGAGTPRPLVGVCNGFAVTFVVNWQECGSTTAWSGTYDRGVLTTLWHLVRARPPTWDSIVAGTSTFAPQ